MGKRKSRRAGARPRRRSLVMMLAVVAVTLGGGTWWLAAPPDPVGGTPRAVLDRETIDFGAVPLDMPVHAVFTLRNAGDGVLRVAEVPKVKVLAGC